MIYSQDIMEILASARIIQDTDVLGGSFKNSGYIVHRDLYGSPLKAQAIKIDTGLSFNWNSP